MEEAAAAFNSGVASQLVDLAKDVEAKNTLIADYQSKIAILTTEKEKQTNPNITNAIDVQLTRLNEFLFMITKNRDYTRSCIDNINAVANSPSDDLAFFYSMIMKYTVPYVRWRYIIRPKFIAAIRDVVNSDLDASVKDDTVQTIIDMYNPIDPKWM